MRKSINQLKVGAILSYAQMALGVIIGLIYTPVMIRLLGDSEYGLYNTVASTISMLGILNLGFNSGYVRYYAKYKKQGDNRSIYKLNGLFLIVFLIIGLVGLLCGGFLTFNLHLVFDEGLTESEYEIAKVLMLLLTVNLAVSFPMSVFSSIISANERFVFLKLLGIVKSVCSPLITLPLLLMGYRSIAMVCVTLGVNIAVDVCYFIYVQHVLKNKFIFRDFEKGIFKSLFAYTGFIAINIIVDQVNYNIDKFLLGRFKGTQTVAVYSVGYTLYQYYMMFSTSVSGVFTPRIHKIVERTKDNISQQKAELTDLFVKVGRIQCLLLGLIASGLVFFGKPFIAYWAGNGYGEAYYVMLLLVLPGSIALIQNCGIEIQRAQNKHQFRSIVYIIMAAMNLVASIFLCQKWGALGATIGTAISLVVANGLIMNIYYHKRCNVDILLFWKNILRILLGILPPIAVGVLIVLFIDLYVIWYLLLFIVLYTIIYCISVWFLSMNNYEKELIKQPLRKIFRRNK